MLFSVLAGITRHGSGVDHESLEKTGDRFAFAGNKPHATGVVVIGAVRRRQNADLVLFEDFDFVPSSLIRAHGPHGEKSVAEQTVALVETRAAPVRPGAGPDISINRHDDLRR